MLLKLAKDAVNRAIKFFQTGECNGLRQQALESDNRENILWN